MFASSHLVSVSLVTLHLILPHGFRMNLSEVERTIGLYTRVKTRRVSCRISASTVIVRTFVAYPAPPIFPAAAAWRIGLLRVFRSQVSFLTKTLWPRNPRPRPHFRSFDGKSFSSTSHAARDLNEIFVVGVYIAFR